jgi:hypothetical protein
MTQRTFADFWRQHGQQTRRHTPATRPPASSPPLQPRQGNLFGTGDVQQITRSGRPCRCGGIVFQIEPGRGPHAAGLRCVECQTWAGWLPRREVPA